jgi:spore coat protein U-like protein
MKIAGILAAAFLVLVSPEPAEALTCTATATGLAFGVYSANTAMPTDTTGTVTVTCNSLIALLVSYSIALTTGGSGSFAGRTMAGSVAPRLGYQIYTDAARTRIWGDGTGGTVTVADSYLLSVIVPVVRPYTYYGRIPAHQIVGPGIFGDTVTVLITY